MDTSRGYGTMGFTNPTERPTIIPSHSGYIVPQAAQDHAMAGAELLPAKRSQSYDNAMCIQQTQGIPLGDTVPGLVK